MKKEKVLILFSSGGLGGAERSLSRMALASKDVEYKLASLAHAGPWFEWIRNEGATPIALGTQSENWALAFWRLLLYLNNNPQDVIYICGFRAATILRFLRILLPHTKLVHGVRWNPDSQSRLDVIFRTTERLTNCLIDAWITNSLAAKTTLVKRCGIAPKRIRVIYNGIDHLPKLNSSHTQPPPEVVTVANLNPRKGHLEYLDIIGHVIKKVPNSKFVFIGRDDMNGKIQEAITAKGLRSHVEFVDFQKNVSKWLQRAKIFVLPSLWGEGCPTSILEAFGHKLPVLAHNIDGISELVEDGIDGFLFPVGSRSFPEKITELLGDAKQLEQLGKKGREKVSKRFSLDSCIDRHKAAFLELTDK